MIKYIPVHQAKCDKCGKEMMQSNVTQIEFLSFVRGSKWTVGSITLCPNCQPTKETKSKKQPYEQMQLDFVE